MKRKIPTGELTVITRDDSPMISCGDSPSYRTVKIQLTPEQRKELELKHTCSVNGDDYYENISCCILEPDFKLYS